jgi:hypothetical protein
MKLRLSAVWVTMVAFESPVQVPGGMEGGLTVFKASCLGNSVICQRWS